MKSPVINTYYSGAGLMDLGLLEAGIEIGQSFEIDPLCCQTARANFAHQIVECDIHLKMVASENPCHVIVGTYPCTNYSTIADIHGARTWDVSFFHFFRHVAIKRTEVYVMENVPGMRKFPVVME